MISPPLKPHNMTPFLSAKASSDGNRSDSVLVSFDSRWEHAINNGDLKAFIRKRLPKTITPKWIYGYCGSPVAAILARFRVIRVTEVSSLEAVKLASRLGMSAGDVESYCKGRPIIGYCEVAEMQKALRPMTLQDIRSVMSFHPPQSFIILSKTACEIIDSTCFPSQADLE